ncbi:MAG: glutathione S-transferase, partial [Moorea sp. SIO2I5]|nr:glutathione S-transferase [Moorena sp. SIO2I5]
ADIACFPYVSLSPDGKISLDAYPNVLSWMERIKQLPGYVAIA